MKKTMSLIGGIFLMGNVYSQCHFIPDSNSDSSFIEIKKQKEKIVSLDYIKYYSGAKVVLKLEERNSDEIPEYKIWEIYNSKNELMGVSLEETNIYDDFFKKYKNYLEGKTRLDKKDYLIKR